MDSNRLFGRMRQCGMCRLSYCLCQGCDRGHWYCSELCSARAHRESQQQAAKRYRQTDSGRENHAAAQRRYRDKIRRQKDSEIYQSSAAREVSLNPRSSTFSEELPDDDQSQVTTADMIRCHMCKAVVTGFVEKRCYPRRHRKLHKLMRNEFYDFSRNTS